MAEDDYLANNNRGQEEIAARSLCFKLKIPQSEPATAVVVQDQEEDKEEEKEEDKDKEEEELLGFACPACDKRFKSGKALGGHKRMHNININNKKVAALALVVDDDDDKEEDDVVDEEDVVVCPECSKSFPSKKSLFGHMRSHPERTWRGIHPPPPPPPPNSSCSISVVSDSPPVGWSVTGKRGRMSTTSSSASVESSSSEALERQVVLPGMDEDMKEAVLDLMLLAHDNPNTKPAAGDAIGECRSDAENDEPRKWSEEEDCSDSTKKKRKRPKMKLMDCLQKEEEEEEDEEQVELESSSSKQKVIPSSNDEENKKKKKKKKKKKMMKKAASSVVDDATTEKVNKYVCSACDKSFSSYQALGGHRSSHNKLPYLNKTNIIINATNQHQHHVLNFDLNEPPPPEDEL